MFDLNVDTQGLDLNFDTCFETKIIPWDQKDVEVQKFDLILYFFQQDDSRFTDTQLNHIHNLVNVFGKLECCISHNR